MSAATLPNYPIHPYSSLQDADSDVVRWWCEGLAPPPDLTVSEWAERYRRLSTKSSSEAGRWKNARTPYLVEIMDRLSVHDPCTRVVFQKGSQVGGTECGNNWIGYCIHIEPGPFLYVVPRTDDAKFSSKQRLDPLIEETPELASRVKPKRSRDSGNTEKLKEFPYGLIRLVGANAAAGLKSMPARFIFADEVDEYPLDVGKQGDPLSLTEVRSRTFFDKKLFEVSSPTEKKRSLIERDYRQTDQRRFFVPCPHCEEKQWLKWKQVRWRRDEDRNPLPQTAVYVCEHCGSEIEEHHKTWMLEHGEWRATAHPKRLGWTGYHLSSLYSPLGWFSWAEAADLWIAANTEKEPDKRRRLLKTFINTVLAETWEELGDSVESKNLLERCELYSDQVPAPALLLTVGADVQTERDNPRIEVTVYGWGPGEEGWLVDRLILQGDPFQDQVWDDLTHVLDSAYQHESGATLTIDAALIDSGDGNITERVYNYVAQKTFKNRRIFAYKGVGGDGVPLIGKPSLRQPSGAVLYPVGADEAKMTLFSRLAEAGDGPGRFHFPLNHPAVDEEFFEQLGGEHRVYENSKYVWKKKRHRQEVLDCTVMAFAAFRIAYIALKSRRRGWDYLQRQIDAQTSDEATQSPQPPPTVEARKRTLRRTRYRISS